MTQRIPNTESPTEVRQAFQRLVGDTDVITAGQVGEVLIGAGTGVVPTWSTILTTLTLLTVDNITIDGATITSDSGTVGFGNENLTTTGVVTAGQVLVDNLLLDGALIESDTGAISFGDENLSTAGTITGVNVTSGADPGHTHTGASVSGLDISSDTNLTVVAPIVLTDDELSLNQAGIDHGTIGGLDDADHDAVYYQESEHVNSSAGAGDAGKPIVLDAAGHVDATMINDGDVDHANLGNVTSDQHHAQSHNAASHSDIASTGAAIDATVTASGKVKVDAGATADFLGAAFSDGALRTSTGISYADGGNFVTLTTNDGEIVHANLSGYVAAEHVDHSGVTLTAGSGLTGTGDISASRTFDLDINSLGAAGIAGGDFVPFWDITATATNKKITFTNFEAALNHNSLLNYEADRHIAHSVVSISGGSGISGGGDITLSRTLALDFNKLDAAAIAVGDFLAFWDISVTAICKKITFANLLLSIPGGTDEKVKVDAAATAGYLGVAAGDGVLRVNGALSYVDGGDFVTLGGSGSKAKAYATSDQDIVTGTLTKVTLDTEDFDPGGDFANDAYTAPATGYYFVCGKVRTNEILDAGKIVSVYVYVNGAQQTAHRVPSDGIQTTIAVISDVVYAESGQDIELWVYHNQGSNIELYGTVKRTALTVHRLS